MSPSRTLLFLVVASALLAIVGACGTGRASRWLHWVFKPATTLLVVALLPWESVPGSRYALAIALGLFLSLAGDVFLMLPRDRFVPGLVSFLLAHVAYLAALTADVGPVLDLRVLVPLAAGVAAVIVLLWPGLEPRLRAPVLVYVAALGLMAAQASGRALSTGTRAALLAAVGAVAFVVSDATLALDRFRFPFRGSRVVVLSTYWLAQVLIALSVAG